MLNGLTYSRKRAIRLLAAFALLVGLTTGCGGGSADSGVRLADTVGAEPPTTSERVSGPTKAVLHAVADGRGSGTVLAVGSSSGEGSLKVRLKGLKPAIGETQYALWELSDRHDMYSIGVYRVRHDGRLNEDIVSPGSLEHIEDGTRTEFLVTRVYSDDRWRDALLEAAEAEDPYDPTFIGQPILRGTFIGPLVGIKEVE